MKHIIAIFTLLAATLTSGQAVMAAVVPGTTYGVYLQGSVSGNIFLANPIFDSVAEGGTRDGQLVTINELETSLSVSSSRIDVLISAPNDLFPAVNETAYLGIGVTDPFDLTREVSLDDVRVTLRNIANDAIFSSDNIAYLAMQGSPWDGTFVALLETLGIDEIGGMGVTSIEFNFYVSDFDATAIPEPDGVMLFGLGLLALAVAQRRRQR